jgi:hypothetical protein
MDINEYVETPDALFHFTKTSTAIEHILYTKKFKLSNLYNTNDPREYKFKIQSSKQSFWPLDEVRTEIQRILRFKCRIMSFCSNVSPTLVLSDNVHKKDEHFYSRVWAKSRMWSQYGEGHRGICLVLSKSEIEKAFEGKKTQVKEYKPGYITYLSNSSPHPDLDLSSETGKNVEESVHRNM